MLVETWKDFYLLLRVLIPMLSPKERMTCKKIIAWAERHGNRHHGINQDEVDNVVSFLDTIIGHIPAEWAKNIKHAQYFLRAINNGVNPEWVSNSAACRWWNYFWYNNLCHADPEPDVFDCRVFANKNDCLSNGCYWYDNSCHGEPEPISIPCERHSTKNKCLAAGCYWWKGSCHAEPEPVKPPPPPPPPPPPLEVQCLSHKTEIKCLSAGCYWWDGACHDQPYTPPIGTANPVREFAKQVTEYCATIPITKPIEAINCGILSGILTVAANVFDFLGKKK